MVGSGRPEVVVGSRVAVLSGRHFPSFGAGDEGIVVKVTPDAHNCEVQFDKRPKPVPVALRHLRIADAPSAPAGRGEVAPHDDSQLTSRFAGAERSERSVEITAEGQQKTLAGLDTRCVHCGNVYMADSIYCRHCGHRRAEESEEPSAEPWSGLTSLLHAEGPSLEPIDYMDSTAGFAAGMAAVSGATTNGCRSASHVPGAVVGLDLNQDGSTPKAYHQHQVAAEPEGCAATVTVPMLYTPRGTAYSTLGASTGTQAAAVCGGAVPPELRDRSAEVISLRHALEQCIRAIGTCARAIDSMCVENGFHQSHQGGDGWRSAAAALHDAANLGHKALQATSADSVSIVPCAAPAVDHATVPPTRRLSVASSSGPTAVPVEVLHAGAMAHPAVAANQHLDSHRRFLVASPPGPPPPGQFMPAGLHPVTLGSGPPCMHPPVSPRGPVHPMGLGMGLGPGPMHPIGPAQHLMGPGPWSQPSHGQSQLDPFGLEPCSGQPCSSPGAPSGQQTPSGHLQPPGNLLGSFSGISLGFPSLGAPMSPPHGAMSPPGAMSPSPPGMHGGPPPGMHGGPPPIFSPSVAPT
mmetsp:Transcript_70876/g.125205  ORF Transcript_70876/g.125205 Transcript_70876/m.125205 type:complete len:577 (+) Transcript_70876:67-1797(+)